MFPSFEDLRDRAAGGNISGDDHQHPDEKKEDDAVGHDGCVSDAEEDRDVDADVVAAVGEGHASDRPDADGLARNLSVTIIVTVFIIDISTGWLRGRLFGKETRR